MALGAIQVDVAREIRAKCEAVMRAAGVL